MGKGHYFQKSKEETLTCSALIQSKILFVEQQIYTKSAPNQPPDYFTLQDWGWPSSPINPNNSPERSESAASGLLFF